jgi:hypothetical protein
MVADRRKTRRRGLRGGYGNAVRSIRRNDLRSVDRLTPCNVVGLSAELDWWAWQDSNLQPSGYEPLALTIELQAPTRVL